MPRSRCVLVTTDPDLQRERLPQFPDVPGAVEVGRTERVRVYADAAMGPRGRRVAEALLIGIEEDIDALAEHFGNIALPHDPVWIVIAQLPGAERAYHHGPGAPELYCDARTVPTVEPRYTRFLATALLVDLFTTAQGRGWEASSSNGEALSRVLAAARFPRQLAGFTTAAIWLDGDRHDYVSTAPRDDEDPEAIGCAVLFLNWLHYQLGHSWEDIVVCGAPTLAETYERLNSQAVDAFSRFTRDLDAIFPSGTATDLTNDNPFPRAPSARGEQVEAEGTEVLEAEGEREAGAEAESEEVAERPEAEARAVGEGYSAALDDEELWSGEEWLEQLPGDTEATLDPAGLEVVEFVEWVEEEPPPMEHEPTSEVQAAEGEPLGMDQAPASGAPDLPRSVVPAEETEASLSAPKRSHRRGARTESARSVSRTTLSRALAGVSFPASRRQLMDAAREAGASARVLTSLSLLPARRYKDRSAVLDAAQEVR